jgi:dTMP kinase
LELVIIDGLDGCGKSTQAHLMMQYLKNTGKTGCLRVHPETDNWFGLRAHVYLYSKGKNAHFASALFYMLDVIRSILLFSWRRENFVIFVRYLMGTAYLPSPLDTVAYNFFSLIVPKSKNMFFLDVSPTEAAVRIAENRTETEMFESLEALEKVRARALSLTRFDEWTIIDSNKSVNEVASALRKNMFGE